MKSIRLVLIVSALFLGACGSQPQETSVPLSTLQANPPDATQTLSPTQTQLAPLTAPIQELIVWLPPELTAEIDDPAGTILTERLDLFEMDHPGVEIKIREKASETGAMLEALEATVSAAPSIFPDLVVLDPAGLITAALKGMIQPLEGLLPPPVQPQWYGFASAASRVDGVFYGLPLVSEADVFAYRVTAYESPPLLWTDILSSPDAILLPLSDPLASFTMAQYLALEGQIVNGSGKPTLDAAVLAEVLEFYLNAVRANRLSTSSFQFSSRSETWTALLENSTRAAPAPLSGFLKDFTPTRHAAIALPTREGEGVSFTQPWSFALTTADPARMALAGDLLEWLLEPAFLGAWSYALGYLPSTAEALSTWPEGPEAALASELVASGRPYPDQEFMLILSPLVQSAIDEVLRSGISPAQAAQNAVDQLEAP